MPTNQIKLELIKNEAGITASNQTTGIIDFFDETEEARKEFLLYFLQEFINKEIE